MKKILIMFLLYSGICLGQQGINYKAIISDNGAVVQNQQVGISFTILEDGITEIYKELHVLNTDANGLVITNIGEGITTIGSFETLDWSQEYFLNVEVDTGNGTVDMGTTAFKYVPYALHAKTAETFTGTIPNTGKLVKVTEGGDEGYRLVDALPDNHGNIGDEAIDLSFQSSVSETKGATDRGAFASGYNTEASAEYSVAFGYNTQASDTYATSFGAYTKALGYASSAFGNNTKASGYYTTVFGSQTTASSYNQTTMGSYNTEISGSSNSFIATDPLFVIGNGTSDGNRSDALIVNKNGETEINGALIIDASNDDTGYTLPTELGEEGYVLTRNYGSYGTHWRPAGSLVRVSDNGTGHKGYKLFDSYYNGSVDIGSNAIDLSLQTSVNDSGASGESAFAIGESTEASGKLSIATGQNSVASGQFSMVGGYYSLASGNNSFAMGNNNIASGSNSVTMGNNNTASGDSAYAFGSNNTASANSSIAMGTNNTASKWGAIALGLNNIADSYHQTSIGYYCTETDPNDIRLFVIGNGDGDHRRDAMEVNATGDTTINGDLKVEELNAIDSGDADMKAYIYGLIIKEDGNKAYASSGGFQSSKLGTGYYRITFDNPPSSHINYLVMATLNQAIGFVYSTKRQQYIDVLTYNTAGVLTDLSFNFVVYKK